MNILIHSNNIYFNIGIAQCFRDIQKTAPELKVIHSLPLSHLPELSGLDVIILSLENYHDYLAAAEIAQHFQGLVIGFTSAGNVRRGRSFFADTLLWVSQREAVREVSRLLRCSPSAAGHSCRVTNVRAFLSVNEPRSTAWRCG